MTDTRTYLIGGGAVAALLLLMASGKKREADGEAAPEGERADDEGTPIIAAAGFNPQRFVSEVPDMGTLFEVDRGCLMLGTGQKSLTYRVLLAAAQLAGAGDPEAIASDSAARVAYAKLILAAPANAVHLTKNLRAKDVRNVAGYGIDLRRRPVLWLPILDLDMLARGVVQVAVYEEDGELCTELPPEIREVMT